MNTKKHTLWLALSVLMVGLMILSACAPAAAPVVPFATFLAPAAPLALEPARDDMAAPASGWTVAQATSQAARFRRPMKSGFIVSPGWIFLTD